MTDEKKALLVSIIFGVIETIFNVIAYVRFSHFVLVISSLVSVVLVFVILKLFFNYKKAVDSYDFIKFMYFGSEYNGFNLFPKLKIYMDYLDMKNQVEVNSIEFECVDDISSKNTNVQWIIRNIYNNTNRDIKSYYLYTANEYGLTDGVSIEVREGNQILPIDTNNIRKSNLIQQIPFTFHESIKAKETIPEIKISMNMHDDFVKWDQKIVYLYPRNYGTKVDYIRIVYRIRGAKKVSVILHEIGRGKKGYYDEPIKSCVPREENGEWIYYFSLSKEQINVDSLYYLFINEK